MSDEIKAARHFAEWHAPTDEQVATINAALDALEREPELQARITILTEECDTCKRVIARDATLARVRAFRNTLNGSGCAWEESIKPFRDALDVALDGEVKP